MKPWKPILKRKCQLLRNLTAWKTQLKKALRMKWSKNSKKVWKKLLKMKKHFWTKLKHRIKNHSVNLQSQVKRKNQRIECDLSSQSNNLCSTRQSWSKALCKANLKKPVCHFWTAQFNLQKLNLTHKFNKNHQPNNKKQTSPHCSNQFSKENKWLKNSNSHKMTYTKANLKYKNHKSQWTLNSC